MWYVNASSINTDTSTYYALINNFPGQVNSTTEQQLVVADFSKTVPEGKTAPAKVIPIVGANSILQFITYSKVTGKLFYSGLRKNGGVLETTILWSQVSLAAGPLVANDNDNTLLCFNKEVVTLDTWAMVSLPYNYLTSNGTSGYVSVIKKYTGDAYKVVAGAVISPSV
eukprot:gene24452-30802_t